MDTPEVTFVDKFDVKYEESHTSDELTLVDKFDVKYEEDPTYTPVHPIPAHVALDISEAVSTYPEGPPPSYGKWIY